MQYHIKRRLIISLLSCISIVIYSQQFEIRSPLEIPLYLSGNFAELRNTHFHGGIDIKTQTVTGKRVLAIADGYVSRVKIQSGGYGHAIYVSHPNGYTSIYCHLQEFSSELEKWVKNEQYRKKTFEIDLFPDSNQFIVTQGQFIALSGSTGRSGGPHLHLEVRDEKDIPINVLKLGLPIADSIAPKFLKLFIYDNIDIQTFESLDRAQMDVTGKNNKYKIIKPVHVSKRVAFGLEIYDFLNGSANKCGVYSLELLLDNSPIYFMQLDKVSYEEVSYIKTYSDYAEKMLNKKGIHRLFVEPNNKLSIYRNVINNGIIESSGGINHNIKIIAKDVSGNQSTLEFTIIQDKEPKPVIPDLTQLLFKYNQPTIFENENAKFSLEENSLYSDKWFNYAIQASDSFYSGVHTFGNWLIPTDKYPELSLRVTKSLEYIFPEKLIIVGVDMNGKLTSEGGHWSDGWVTAKVSGFGSYAVALDTSAPIIKPVRFKNYTRYSKSDAIAFKITDNLSGIKTYNGYIDDNWALFEYDLKSDSLFYRIDSLKLDQSKKVHDLKLFVTDDRNNIATFNGKFYF